MNKKLKFEIKQNLRKPSRVYVRSADIDRLFGSFQVNALEDFDGWGKLSKDEALELKHFLQNIQAVNKYLKPDSSNQLTDFRFRLPIEFIETIDELSAICLSEAVEFDIFDPMIMSIIHQMRIATSKLDSGAKMKALSLLDKASLADFKKQNHIQQIQSVFTEVQAIYNRSEKLHQKAQTLFNKNKSYSPRAIKGMSIGETLPSKWLVACAIDLLIDEVPDRIKGLLTANDFYILWAKPLKDSTYNRETMLERSTLLGCENLMEKTT